MKTFRNAHKTTWRANHANMLNIMHRQDFPCFFSHFLTFCKDCSWRYGFPQDNCTTMCSFHNKCSSLYCYIPFMPPRVFSYQASSDSIRPSIYSFSFPHDPWSLSDPTTSSDSRSRRLSTTPFSLSRFHSEFLFTSHFLPTTCSMHSSCVSIHSHSPRLPWQDDQGHQAAREHGTLSQWWLRQGYYFPVPIAQISRWVFLSLSTPTHQFQILLMG